MLAHIDYATTLCSRGESVRRAVMNTHRGKVKGEVIMAKGDALKAHIEALRSAIPELKGVLLASNEGLPIPIRFRMDRIRTVLRRWPRRHRAWGDASAKA